MCYMAVYISDVMNAIDNADASDFDFEALERWRNKRLVIRLGVERELNTKRLSGIYNHRSIGLKDHLLSNRTAKH